MTDLTNLHKYKPCPNCPDGNEWSSNGPTGRRCRLCHGGAMLHNNGAPLTSEELSELYGRSGIMAEASDAGTS